MSPADRLAGLDTLRGVAILFVVVIHAARPLEPDTYRELVVGGVARLGVPLFVLLSGVLAGLGETGAERFRSHFIKFVRLHVIWAIFYIPISIWKRGLPDPLSWKYVALRFGEAGWPGQYYFLILISLFFVVAFVAPPPLWRRGATLVACALLATASLIGLHWLIAQSGPRAGPIPSVLQSKVQPGYWAYYFALGCFVGTRMRAGTAWRLPMPAAALLGALAVVIAMFGLPLPGDDADPMALAYQRPRIYLAMTLLALALPAIARTPAIPWLSALGRDSFGVFVLNPVLLFSMFVWLGPPSTPATSLAFAAAALLVGLPLAVLLRQRLPWAYA